MKLGLIVLACAAALIVPVATSANASVPAREPVSFTVIAPPTYVPVLEVPEQTIVAAVPHKHVAARKPAAKKPLQFVCGEAYNNDVGGRNSDCRWL